MARQYCERTLSLANQTSQPVNGAIAMVTLGYVLGKIDSRPLGEPVDLLLGTQGWRRFAEQDPDRDYAVAGSFVAFLLDRGGIEAMVATKEMSPDRSTIEIETPSTPT